MFGMAKTTWQTQNVERNEARPLTSCGHRVGALYVERLDQALHPAAGSSSLHVVGGAWGNSQSAVE
jgi:hypothetical protein